MKKKNNIKPLAAIIFIVTILFLIAGGTFAYFTNNKDLENEFKTKVYKTKVIEEFISPDNWTPGTTTNKTIFVSNSGDADVAVRVSYSEKWTSANGDELSLEQDDKVAAIINFADNLEDNWTLEGNYYYYNKKLEKNDNTTSFIKSVTFNDEIDNDVSCVVRNNKKTCTSTGDGYDGATYVLTIYIETVQYDSYKTVWNTDVVISDISSEEIINSYDVLIKDDYLSDNRVVCVNNEENMICFEPNRWDCEWNEETHSCPSSNSYILTKKAEFERITNGKCSLSTEGMECRTLGAACIYSSDGTITCETNKGKKCSIHSDLEEICK